LLAFTHEFQSAGFADDNIDARKQEFLDLINKTLHDVEAVKKHYRDTYHIDTEPAVD
jgi:hypothetical protein